HRRQSPEALKNTQAEQNIGRVSAISRANRIASSRIDRSKKPLLNLDSYKSIAQKSMYAGDMRFIYEQQLVIDEISNLLLSKLIKFREKSKRSFKVSTLKNMLKDDILNNIFSIMK